MTQTDPALGVAPPTPPPRSWLTRRRSPGQDFARFVIFAEAVLLLLFAAAATLGRQSPVIGVLAFIGSGVLFWGGVRMRGDQAGPPPPPADPFAPQATRYVPWNWTDVLMFVPGAFIAASLLANLVVPLTDVLTQSNTGVRTAAESFAQQLSFYGGAIFNIWVLAGLRRGARIHDLGWRRFAWWWIPVAVVAAVGTLYIADWLQIAAEHLFPGAQNTQCQAVQHDYRHFIVLAAIVVCVMAPLAEEMIFRGFVFGWLQHALPVGAAIVISGAIFGAAHLVLVLFIPLWAVGIVLAVMYRSSNSLWPGALVHALFNLPGIIAILTSPNC